MYPAVMRHPSRCVTAHGRRATNTPLLFRAAVPRWSVCGQPNDDTAAWASIEDVREYTARADAQVREALGRVLTQRCNVEVAFGYLTMAELADGLYHRRRGADLLAGAGPGWLGGRGAGRRWRQPGASSLSRARDKLGADPLHMLFDHVAGPVAAGGAPGVSCCGLRVISMDDGRSTTDVPDSAENAAFFGRPSMAGREGAFPQVRWVTAAESGTGGADAGAGPAAVLRAGDAGAGRPELPVLVPGPRRAGHRRTSCGGPRRASRSGR